MDPILEQLWRFALAGLPLVVMILLLTRLLPCRPSTRHTLWLTVLVVLIVAPLVPAPSPERVASGVWAGRLAASHATAILRGRGAEEPVAAAPDRRPSNDSHAIAPRRTPAAPISSSAPVRGLVDATAPESSGSRLVIPRADIAEFATPAPDVAVPAPRWRDRRPSPPTDRPRTTTNAARTPAPFVAPVSTEGAAAVAPARSQTATPRREVARAEPVASPEWRRRAGVVLGHARDAIAAIPPLPTGLWLGGGIALLLLGLVRAEHLRRRLRDATPAPLPVQHVVRRAASDLGLTAPPRCVMTTTSLSPLVWCGRRPTLVLPEELWQQLDSEGRRAVVYHELAHLRRRDHWVCWIVTLATCIYWWNPVVWWIRRCLREEADLCCDAWVVTLLPHARRAYAAALLETKRLMSAGALPTPAVGLGATTLRTRRFARRITMVMTKSIGPRITLAGVALTGTMALAGWLVTPALACPPDAKAKAPKAASRPARIAIPAPPTPPAPPAAPRFRSPPSAPDAASPDGYRSTFEEFMRQRDRERERAPRPDDISVEERIHDLESQIDRMVEALARWSREFEGSFRGGQLPARVQGSVAPMVDAARQAYEEAMGQFRRTAPGVAAPMAPAADPFGAYAAEGEEISHEYVLSKGKLEDLTELMARSDVPVLISPGDESITVHGTAREHAIFSAFVRMIDPDHAERNQAPVGARSRGSGLSWTTAVPAPDDARSELEARLEAVRRLAAESETAAEAIHDQCEQLADVISSLDDKISDLEDAREDAESRQERRALKADIDAITAEKRALEREANRLERQAEAAAERHERALAEVHELMIRMESRFGHQSDLFFGENEHGDELDDDSFFGEHEDEHGHDVHRVHDAFEGHDELER